MKNNKMSLFIKLLIGLAVLLAIITIVMESSGCSRPLNNTNPPPTPTWNGWHIDCLNGCNATIQAKDSNASAASVKITAPAGVHGMVDAGMAVKIVIKYEDTYSNLITETISFQILSDGHIGPIGKETVGVPALTPTGEEPLKVFKEDFKRLATHPRFQFLNQLIQQ